MCHSWTIVRRPRDPGAGSRPALGSSEKPSISSWSRNERSRMRVRGGLRPAPLPARGHDAACAPAWPSPGAEQRMPAGNARHGVERWARISPGVHPRMVSSVRSRKQSLDDRMAKMGAPLDPANHAAIPDDAMDVTTQTADQRQGAGRAIRRTGSSCGMGMKQLLHREGVDPRHQSSPRQLGSAASADRPTLRSHAGRQPFSLNLSNSGMSGLLGIRPFNCGRSATGRMCRRASTQAPGPAGDHPRPS